MKKHTSYILLIISFLGAVAFGARLLDVDQIRSSDRVNLWTLPTTGLIASNGTLDTTTGTATLTNKSISLGSNTLTSTSAQLSTALSDETGSGAAVFGTSPTLTTPVLGAATGTSLALGSTLNASSILDLTSTSKGMLAPRMTQAQRDAISTPATGLQIYNTDSNKLNVYNGSSWGEVGSGSSGTNYIVDYDGSAIGSWTTYADAAGTDPVDGTGGSPNVTFAVSTNSSMRGTSNFLFTKDAANRQGQGFSYNFTIDPSDKGKVLQISNEYLVSSGSFVDDDLQFWIYDVTNAALIQPAPYKAKNSNLIEKFGMEFQTNTTSASYRLIGHVASTGTNAYTLRFDNWNLGPQAKLYGSPITDWVSYTPTTQGFGTITISYAAYRRVGDSIEIQARFTAGTPTAVEAQFGLPSGYSIGSSSTILVGEMSTQTDTTIKKNILATLNSTYIKFGDNLSALNGSDVAASSDIISLYALVKINGLSSSTVMSSDADTRVVAMQRFGTPTSSLTGSYTDVIWGTGGTYSDTHAGYNSTTGVYTVPVSGYYKTTAQVYVGATGFTTSNTAVVQIVKGSTAQAFNILLGAGNLNSATIKVDWSGYLTAGETLKAQARSDATTPTYASANTGNFFLVERISGPSQIAASETVAARYETDAGQSITNGASPITVDFEDRVFDSHGSVTTGASWKFTAPISGLYEVRAMTNYANATFTAGNSNSMRLYKNGSEYSFLDKYSMESTTSGGVSALYGSSLIRLLSGEYVNIGLIHNESAARSLFAGAPRNYIEVIRVGNY